jgi:hypothetical protein|tara:strand:- start:1 stop:348 length:348 start_codon:yes stop_codon:yes gene_type:complete
MINENMKSVIVALRSGKYKQTVGALQNSCGHCILGVICEVYETDTGESPNRDLFGRLMGDDLSNHMDVQEWVGLVDVDGDCGLTKPSLMTMNDIEKKSFLEIADFIETDPEGLLV